MESFLLQPFLGLQHLPASLAAGGKCSTVGVLVTRMSDLKLQHCGIKATLFRGCCDVLAVPHSSTSSLHDDLSHEREVHFMVKKNNQQKA